MNHDVIVIGGSAGGVEVMLDLVGALPPDLPASIFVVLHTMPGHESPLPGILSRRGPLPVSHPFHGQKIEPGHIYLAPPDNHLLVKSGSMEVVRGARENGHRPAADALFRTASSHYGPRVIGVVLSGYQNCGTAGMISIKERGGISVVQDPATAVAPEMPSSAIERVAVDHVVQPADLGSLLSQLALTPASEARQPNRIVDQLEGRQLGARAEISCPSCQGVLTEAQIGSLEHFRCHVGHAFTLDSLVREQGEEMERALWAAVRSLEEGSALSRRFGGHARGDLRQRFLEKATQQRQEADVIRQILLRGDMLRQSDADRISQETVPGQGRVRRPG